MSMQELAARVAAKVYFQELAAQRALDAAGGDAYYFALKAMDAVYSAAFAPDRPAVWPKGSEPR